MASVTVIHVPDDKYALSARILFQYLLTSQGNMFELKVRYLFGLSRWFLFFSQAQSQVKSCLLKDIPL